MKKMAALALALIFCQGCTYLHPPELYPEKNFGYPQLNRPSNQDGFTR